MKFILNYNNYMNHLNEKLVLTSFSINEDYNLYHNGEVAKIISYAKHIIITNLKFFGSILESVPIYEEPNASICKTFSTNGVLINYNPDFVEKKLNSDVKQVIFVILHELLHIVYDHLNREKNLNIPRNKHHDFNVAADFAINPIIINVDKNENYISKSGYNKDASLLDRQGNIIAEFPSNILYEVQFIGLDVAEIYYRLLNDKKLNKLIPSGDDRYTGEHKDQNSFPKYKLPISPEDAKKEAEAEAEAEKIRKQQNKNQDSELVDVKKLLLKIKEEFNNTKTYLWEIENANSQIWILYVFEQLVFRLNKIINLAKNTEKDLIKDKGKSVYIDHYKNLINILIDIKKTFNNIGNNTIKLTEFDNIKKSINKLNKEHNIIVGTIDMNYDVSNKIESDTNTINVLLKKLDIKLGKVIMVPSFERKTTGNLVISKGTDLLKLTATFKDLINEYIKIAKYPKTDLIINILQYINLLEYVDNSFIDLGKDLLKQSKKTNTIYEEIKNLLLLFEEDKNNDEDKDKDPNEGDYEESSTGDEGEDENGKENKDKDKPEKDKGNKDNKDLSDKIEKDLDKEIDGALDKTRSAEDEVADDKNIVKHDDQNIQDPESVSKIKSKIKSIVESAIKGRGTGSPVLDRIIDKMFEVDRNWKKELKDYFDVVSQGEDKRSFPKRRYVSQDLYISDFKKGENGIDTLYILIDTSGSVSLTQLKEFASEINEISKQIRISKTVLLNFDSLIHEPPIIYYENDNIILSKLKGGGGTNIPLAFNWIERNYESVGEPSAVLMFTDGYDDFPKSFQFAEKTLWIINNKHKVGNFGKTLHIETQG